MLRAREGLLISILYVANAIVPPQLLKGCSFGLSSSNVIAIGRKVQMFSQGGTFVKLSK
jgi:hypothetical protein